MKTTANLILCMMFALVPFNMSANTISNNPSAVYEQDDSYDYAIKVLDKANERIKNKDITGGVDYFINNIQRYRYDNDELLYFLASSAEDMRNVIMQYNNALAMSYNGYNVGTVLAEGYNNSNRVIKLNAIMIEYCVRAADMGHDDAQAMLRQLQVQAQLNNSAGSYPNNSYQNSGNNEYRKKQLLDNIATYEKRIREVQSQLGNGIATDAMGNQTISNYRRMIEEAKRELRSMGYNIY